MMVQKTWKKLLIIRQDFWASVPFLAEARNLPPLTEAQKNKLRHLSVVTLAAKVKVSDSPEACHPIVCSWESH